MATLEVPAEPEEPVNYTTVALLDDAQPQGARRGSLDRSPEAAQKDIEDNMNHELKELEGTSIASAFQDFNYWKPDVDYNVEDLISQAKGK